MKNINEIEFTENKKDEQRKMIDEQKKKLTVFSFTYLIHYQYLLNLMELKLY